MSILRSLGCLLAAVFCVGEMPSAHANGVAVTQARLKAIHLEDGVPFLTFDQPVGNPDGCASNAVVTLASDLANQQFYLSLAMTALTTGKSVTVWVSGCAWAPWFPSVPKVHAMQIIP